VRRAASRKKDALADYEAVRSAYEDLGIIDTYGLLEVMLRGPLGALALAKLRDKIRAAAHLAND
jgi:hypothetical protein